MKRLLFILMFFLISSIAFAQIPTTITNTITSPTDGEVNIIPYEPYTIPMSGVANASGGTDVEIVITLDESGSISSSNWQLEKQGAQYLVNRLQNPSDPTKLLARVGLVGFDDSAYTKLSPPSTNYATVSSAITAWGQHGGLTSFGAALINTDAIFDLNGNSDEEIGFFFSNGGHNTNPPFQTVADAMHTQGVLFNCFGIASSVNEGNLQYIAGTSSGNDGHYWHAPSFGQLQAAIDAAIPSTGGVSLDRVEVFVDGSYVGNAVLSPGGIYSLPVGINYGSNEIKTIAYSTDGASAIDQVIKYGDHGGTPPIPEPGTMILVSLGLVGLIGGACARRRAIK